MFFPARAETIELARALCAECPVIDECRRWSVDQPDHSVLAGLSGRQRRRLRAERKRGDAA